MWYKIKIDKITVKTKYTDGTKFADPSMAAVSPY